MKKIILTILAIIIFFWLLYGLNPTKAEVDRFFEENSCYSKSYCVYYEMRRNTAMLGGQIFKIPIWWVFPNFMLYTTTPFNYYHEMSHGEDDWHTYIWVDTRDGRLVYNAVSGEFIKEIDDKENPSKKYWQEMKDHVQKIRTLQENS